ncbi:hypothetical protein ENBRE01_0635 [Enteropsectra breve]|nr:hypothetical protein ENBRE01_0635 [Enteropsectra breve]
MPQPGTTKEIEAIIGQFEDDHKKQLIEYYIEKASNKFAEQSPFKKQKMQLLLHTLKYVEKEAANEYIAKMMHHKIVQARTLILDLLNVNYAMEQEYIYKPEKWILSLIADIRDTFNLENYEELKIFKIYNQALCEELIDIFCACERFNTAGNQLILDIYVYKEFTWEIIREDMKNVMHKLIANFNEGKFSGMSKIKELYEEYKEHKKQK